jgi:PAS domain S-box-containing protein
VDSAAEAILVAQDGVIQLINPTTVEVTGYSEQELLSKPFLPLIHPDDRALATEGIEKVVKGEVVQVRNEFRVLTKGGNTKWVRGGMTSIDWEGRPATLNLLTEITERKNSELELEKKTAEAIESGQKAEAYFDFMAHDIANILSPIIAYADMLKVRPNNPEQVIKFSSKILEQGHRASSLISNLRRLESIEKTHPNEIDTIDLRTLFSSLEDGIRSDFPKKDITISYGLPDVQSMNVKGGEWVENVFKCVYDNAVRYSTGSAVELEIRASMLQQEGKEPCWQIEVSDHGSGIPDIIKSHFADNINIANREFKGVASSLPFCVSMMRVLGGELLIQDRIPGDYKQGTRVTIRLPKGE